MAVSLAIVSGCGATERPRRRMSEYERGIGRPGGIVGRGIPEGTPMRQAAVERTRPDRPRPSRARTMSQAGSGRDSDHSVRRRNRSRSRDRGASSVVATGTLQAVILLGAGRRRGVAGRGRRRTSRGGRASRSPRSRPWRDRRWRSCRAGSARSRLAASRARLEPPRSRSGRGRDSSPRPARATGRAWPSGPCPRWPPARYSAFEAGTASTTSRPGRFFWRLADSRIDTISG